MASALHVYLISAKPLASKLRTGTPGRPSLPRAVLWNRGRSIARGMPPRASQPRSMIAALLLTGVLLDRVGRGGTAG